MHGISLEIQKEMVISFHNLVLDYNGTLAHDGILLPGVRERLTTLACSIRITVLTADTFVMAEQQLEGIPIQVHVVRNGLEKLSHIMQIVPEPFITIGNGRNDVPMMEKAGLRIAVVGPEGVAVELLQAADIVVTDINRALDLLINPLQVKATLRD